MRKFTKITFKLLDLLVIFMMIFASPISVLAANPSANIDQCANGQTPSPSNNGCNGTAGTDWVNGNVNEAKAVYFEGDTVPYRLRFDNLSLTSHTVTIEWDTTKSGKHALDYITTFNQSVLDANPCLGVSGCGAPTTFPIPADPQVTGAGVTPIAGNFTMYGGTITAVSVYSYPTGTGFAGDKSAQLTITFTASVANPVLAWGGHIATRTDWGPGNSAVSISGSPYHTRLIALDGSGGNQDRSLSAAAVIFPASITIIKDANPNDVQDFGFTSTGGLTPATFSLDDDSDPGLSNTQSYPGILTFTSYTFTEGAVAGWTLSFGTPVCTVTSANGGTQSGNAGTRTLTINLNEGENVTCTFINTRQAGTLIVIKHVINDNSGTAVASDFTMTVTGNSPSPASFPGAESPGTSVSLSPGAYSVGETGPSGYSSSFSADCSGSIAAGQTKTCTVTNDDVATPHLAITKVATETSYSTVGDVIHYTITATNDGNTTLAAVTVTDPSVTGLTCTPANGSPLAPGASMTCTATHTVTQADIDAGHYANTACVDDGAGGAAQACASKDVPGSKNPHLIISKVATESGYSAVGDVIHYTITATNDGNTTLAAVTITDANATLGTCTPANGSPLAPGESITCSASHTITQADIDAGSYFNQACVDDGAGGAAQACDDVTTPGSQNPHLTISKVATESGFSTVGDVIHYTIVATNDGNTTLAAVTITDANATLGTCTPANGSPLAPGGTITCSASHTITQADIDAGSYFNQACVDDGAGGAAQACDDVTTPGEQSAVLTLTKTDNLNPALYDHVGQIVTYTLTAKNEGTVTLHNVTVTDNPALTGFSCTPASPVASLAPGASVVCTGTHSITQADLNSGSFLDTGTADSNETTPVDAPDTIHAAPRLIVIKHVINNNGGTKTAADFTMTVDDPGTNPPSFAGAESPGTIVVVDAGSYSVSETGPSGYSASSSPDCSGTIAIGETKTCTVTNDDQAAHLIIIKHVINDNGGTAVAADFTLDSGGANDTPDNFAGAEAPGTDVTLDAGSYAVTETGPSGYTRSDSADCSGTIANGETKTCTVTNNDVQPVPSQITPTATTCSQFNSGTAPTLSELQYAVKSGKVSSVAPGVFFYWVKVTAVAGNNSFTINQAITSSNNNFNHFFTQTSGSFAYTSGCVKINANISTSSSGVTTVSFNASSAGTYIIGIKYDSASVKGFNAPSPNTTVHYTFTLGGSPSSTQGLDLKKKP